MPPTDVSSFNGVDSYWYMDTNGAVRLQMPSSTTGIFIASDGRQTFTKAPICNPAPTDPKHLVNKEYVDGVAGGANLPLAGGTMTGTIAAPIAIPMSFMNTYSLFSQNGGVSFRFGATDLISFSSTGIYNYKPIYTPATGIGISFGTGGGYISKTGVGFSCYIGGAQRFSFDSTAHTSSVPIVLPADPTADLQAATKKYVDGKPTIVSIPAGSTPPDSANYPNNTLLVEYTA
jgi:hypothetical protein